MWLFGYGSLVWRPAFPYANKQPARLDGWKRRFYQASPDHRGTPDAPGRVVTLLPEPSEQCWGMAYRVPEKGRGQILDDLDFREKAGYERHQLPLHLADEHGTLTGEVVEGLVYVANRDNPNFIGSCSMEEMAQHIYRSVGPSGANIEYLVELSKALASMGVHDPHVVDLMSALQPLLDN
ncbi:MAG: gamma-glutamylcyclotransferase [Deltaproteobacteria bacterium]|nr:MAG: gamma-glutamylcyclotransferase [Deltaproteobacteria bacterium]